MLFWKIRAIERLDILGASEGYGLGRLPVASRLPEREHFREGYYLIDRSHHMNTTKHPPIRPVLLPLREATSAVSGLGVFDLYPMQPVRFIANEQIWHAAAAIGHV